MSMKCVVCNRDVHGKGWFCSSRCDWDELVSRVVQHTVTGLRWAGGFAILCWLVDNGSRWVCAV